MKNCGSIRWELSAYLDGELTPPQRTEVEEHLASCARCRGELNEMKALVTGVAALPKLQPAPRFLANVRRKIARDEKPEAMTWGDYVFRPLWLKVPLEVAALIVVVVLAMRGGAPPATEKFARLESAKMENREYDQMNGALSETATKVGPADALKSKVTDQVLTAPDQRANVSSSRERLDKNEKTFGVTGTPGFDIVGDKKQSADELPPGGELSVTPASAPAPIGGMVQSMELAQSKPGETITVHSQRIDDVRNLAQRLAARCSGRIVTVPLSEETTGQIFFVELPREYVAAFKLELLKASGATTALAKDGIGERPGLADAAPSSAGVLTGNAVTNKGLNAPSSLGLRDDTKATAPTAVLEIRVVAPAN